MTRRTVAEAAAGLLRAGACDNGGRDHVGFQVAGWSTTRELFAVPGESRGVSRRRRAWPGDVEGPWSCWDGCCVDIRTSEVHERVLAYGLAA